MRPTATGEEEALGVLTVVPGGAVAAKDVATRQGRAAVVGDRAVAGAHWCTILSAALFGKVVTTRSRWVHGHLCVPFDGHDEFCRPRRAEAI